MSWAVVSVTRRGAALGSRLQEYIPGLVHYTKYPQHDDKARPFHGALHEVVAELFTTHEILIFIMATGIVIRSITGLLRNKVDDPGIVVIDERGRYVISLLSGHIGGANQAAQEIAHSINALPVITTASDVNNMCAPDMLAKKYNCTIVDTHKCKEVTAIMVNGGSVELVADSEVGPVYPYAAHNHGADAVLYLTRHRVSNEKRPYAQLVPRSIYLGVGCKQGTDEELLINFVKEELDRLDIQYQAIHTIASIDIKKDEHALHFAADYFKCALKFFTVHEIKEVAHLFEQSEFVQATLGIGSVSEPAAYLASHRKGSLLLHKKIHSGMTLSIAEVPLMEIQ